jgi:5'-deoxynucleotidase
MSHFFAYLSRMKYIKRWGLMRNTKDENIQEHSLQAAMIAHALALIKNRMFQGNVDPERILAYAVYHEAAEVITGDLATPIKYYNPEINKAYKKIETIAVKKLLYMLPEELRGEYSGLLELESANGEERAIVKAADKICAYLKCVEELKAGNGEFKKAKATIERELKQCPLPEVKFFLQEFVQSFDLTLDELN